jgi:hypothetical protein
MTMQVKIRRAEESDLPQYMRHAMTTDPIAEAQRMVMRSSLPVVSGARMDGILAALGGKSGAIETYTRSEIRESIMALQDYMMGLPDAQLDCPVTHHFAPGSYAREMVIPAGVIIIGKIHRHAHINVVSKGRVRVVTEAGAKIIDAPMTFVSDPGAKRAVFAETETVWTTVHATDETDLDKIEDFVIAKTYEDLGVIDAAPQQEKLQ